MIANAAGTTPAYSLGPLQERGKLFAAEGDNVYEGQLVGIHSKDNDLTVNAIKTKPLTNMRASGKDDAIQLTPAIKYTLEQALDFIEDDELVEVTPKEIRLRKKFLTESDRKRASRDGEHAHECVPRLDARRGHAGRAGRPATPHPRGLPADAPRHDWRTPAQWHMTLRYLGESIDDAQRTRIDAAMDRPSRQRRMRPMPPSSARSTGRMRRCWSRRSRPRMRSSSLLKQLEATMQGCGFAKERAQTAHVTLAYLAHRDAPAQPTPLATPVPLRIDRLQLLRTVPGAYMSLASWPLASIATDA
jgi:2'-5' RNA ligase